MFHRRIVVGFVLLLSLLISAVPYPQSTFAGQLSALTGDPNFILHSLAPGRGSSAITVDLDEDMDNDIVGVAWLGDYHLVWWENNGAGEFTQHVISGVYSGAQDVVAFDIDHDNDLDLASVAYDSISGNNLGVDWWENDGSQNFTRHEIDDSYYRGNEVFAIDMDGDLDGDVLGAASGADDITWWENQGASGWLEHTIDGAFDGAFSVFGVDLDDDDDVDVLGAARDADEVVWWENDGSQNFTPHTLKGDFDGARTVLAVDLDGDDDLDVIAGADGADDIAWWENDGSQNFSFHVIESEFNVARLHVADVDVDGDQDVLAASNSFDDRPSIWWNDGDQNFTRQQIGPVSVSQSLFAADLDADNDLDLAVVSDSTGFGWFEFGAVQPASFPYQNGFESGELGFEWTLQAGGVSSLGLSHNTNPLYAAVGEYCLAMGDLYSTSSDTLTEAVLHINLNAQTSAKLGFYAREIPDPDTGTGVYISDNGVDWHQVLGSEHSSDSWAPASVDLAAEAASNGLTLNDQFQIKFQFYGDGSGGTHNGKYGVDQIIVADELYWPVFGLAAHNDGPTGLGSTTVLSATLVSGDDVTFAWDLGDGTQASGQEIGHIYPSLGVYTAVVTATNSMNILTDTTRIEVIPPVAISGLTASNDGPLPEGTPVRLEASIGAGTNVSYEWDLGDGHSANSQIVDHVYTSPGTYTAVVTATNTENSLSAQTTVEVAVLPECQQFDFGESGVSIEFYYPQQWSFEAPFSLGADNVEVSARLSADTMKSLNLNVELNDTAVLTCLRTVDTLPQYYTCSQEGDFLLTKHDQVKFTVWGTGSPMGTIEGPNSIKFCRVLEDSYLYLPMIASEQ